MRPIGVYLAGAMRFANDAERYDRGWRDIVTYQMRRSGSGAVIFNPLDNQTVCGGDVKLFGEFPVEANAILQQDNASIMRSDIIFMNLLSLDPRPTKYHLVMPPGYCNLEGKIPGGYPHLGTLSELGISYAAHKLLIILATNPAVTGHPFVQAAATRILPTLDAGIRYLQGLTKVLQGSEA
jgi:hypothetical protein